jgi:hypothetical protein
MEDPGPWLGRVIVYKLQVLMHKDKRDGGPAAIFNVGNYKGGGIVLPQLGSVFKYVGMLSLPFVSHF